MGTSERKQREKAERRLAILQAAERVFFKQGIDATTMADVAKEAELAKGTLYLYFKSKDDLCYGINEIGLGLLAKQFIASSKKEERGIDKVVSLGKAYFEFSDKHPEYVEMMLHSDGLNPDEDESENAKACAERAQETLGIFVEIIITGIQDGSIKKSVDPLKTAILLWSFSVGLLQVLNRKEHELKSQFDLERDHMTDYFFDFIVNALKIEG